LKLITVSDNNFAPGVYALVNSLVQNSKLNPLNILILTFEDFQQEWKDRISGLHRVEFQNIRDLGEFRVEGGGAVKSRLVPALQKMLIFKLPYKEELAYIDSDVICLGDLNIIKTFKHFTAPVSWGVPGMTRHTNYRMWFNAGFMVFKPGDIYNDLVAFSTRYKAETQTSEETILNDYLIEKCPDELHILDYRFNAYAKMEKKYPHLWDVNGYKMLHFVGKKPWHKNLGGDRQKLYRKYAWK
jgi:lipopolysaccharide biosynthesis glycosyltransferase